MCNFLAASAFKWINPKELDLNKYNSNSLNSCALEIDLVYPKKLRKLHNEYPLALDKTEIQREMLPNYQIKIASFCIIPTRNIKKLVPNFFDKGKYVLHYENLQLYSRLGLILKQYIGYEKSRKALYKLMYSDVYGKTMENLRNRIDIRLVSNKKDYLK